MVEVRLEHDEILRAVVLAKRRMAASTNLDREKYAKKGLPQLAYDCCAAFAEFAVAKWLGQPEPDGVNTWHAPDVGDDVQVRSIGLTEPGGVSPDKKCLIVRKNDDPAHRFVLVHVPMTGEKVRTMQLLGWIPGKAAQVDAFWRTDAWFVPRNKLQAMGTFRRAVS